MQEYENNGKLYRCVRLPNTNTDLGRWEFKYKDKWHDVVSMQIRMDLNTKFGFWIKPSK
jgi:hypothetical protein